MTLHKDLVRQNCPDFLDYSISSRVARNIPQTRETTEGGRYGNGGMESDS